MLSDVGGGGLANVLDVQPFFLLKKIGFPPWRNVHTLPRPYCWGGRFERPTKFSKKDLTGP